MIVMEEIKEPKGPGNTSFPGPFYALKTIIKKGDDSLGDKNCKHR